MHIIDLSLLTLNEVVMLSGEPRGVAARERFFTDEVAENEKIKIVAPDDLITITPSFVQGFFANRMDLIGLEQFERNLELDELPPHLRQDIQDGLQKLKARRKSQDSRT